MIILRLPRSDIDWDILRWPTSPWSPNASRINIITRPVSFWVLWPWFLLGCFQDLCVSPTSTKMWLNFHGDVADITSGINLLASLDHFFWIFSRMLQLSSLKLEPIRIGFAPNNLSCGSRAHNLLLILITGHDGRFEQWCWSWFPKTMIFFGLYFVTSIPKGMDFVQAKSVDDAVTRDWTVCL